MTASVLYDIPGPVTRRRTAISTAVAGVALAGLIVLVLVQLGEQGPAGSGQVGADLQPGQPVLRGRLDGLGYRAGQHDHRRRAHPRVRARHRHAAGGGAVVEHDRRTGGSWSRCIELLRGLPVVITIYFASRVLPEIGISLPPLWYLVIGLTAYNCVIIAEILRSGVAALPSRPERGRATRSG